MHAARNLALQVILYPTVLTGTQRVSSAKIHSRKIIFAPYYQKVNPLIMLRIFIQYEFRLLFRIF